MWIEIKLKKRKLKKKKEDEHGLWIEISFFNIKDHYPLTVKSLSHSISLYLLSISQPDHQNP